MQLGLSHFEDFQRGGGRRMGVPEQKALCAVRQSIVLLLAPSLLTLISSRTKHQCNMEHPIVYTCWQKAYKKKDRQFPLLLFVTITNTHIYNTVVLSLSVFLKWTSSCCPLVGGAEVKSASHCFCLYLKTVFYYFSSNCL